MVDLCFTEAYKKRVTTRAVRGSHTRRQYLNLHFNGALSPTSIGTTFKFDEPQKCPCKETLYDCIYAYTRGTEYSGAGH